ncbi:MAG TPA: hypothetical protein VFX16_11470 [Pseudonocardiaceae bacterium]|nr:hypothetical protein [Pseudonocardiaceae bacterium]
MTTKSPPPDSSLVPRDPDVAALREVRVALVVQAVLLAVLGGWGLAAALAEPATAPSGVPVLVFHFTWQHALVLLGTVVLSLVATIGHRWVLRCMALQAVGYGVLFVVGAGAHNWFADPADDVLHAVLALLGLSLLMWAAASALTEYRWRRKAG